MTDQTDNQKVYDRTFWLSYVANLLLVTANAMTFRFAEFVEAFGGTEKVAGFIVGCGTAGALFGRLFLGQAIDRFGVRRLWLTVVSLFVLGAGLVAVSDAIGFTLYAGRVAFAIGLAGMFTCSIFHAQNRAPVARRTEVIGNLGSSGFLGMVLGSQLCDLVGRRFAGPIEPGVAFGSVAGIGCVYFALVLLITRRDEHSRPSATPAAYRLIFRFWPGPVVFRCPGNGHVLRCSVCVPDAVLHPSRAKWDCCVLDDLRHYCVSVSRRDSQVESNGWAAPDDSAGDAGVRNRLCDDAAGHSALALRVSRAVRRVWSFVVISRSCIAGDRGVSSRVSRDRDDAGTGVLRFRRCHFSSDSGSRDRSLWRSRVRADVLRSGFSERLCLCGVSVHRRATAGFGFAAAACSFV